MIFYNKTISKLVDHVILTDVEKYDAKVEELNYIFTHYTDFEDLDENIKTLLISIITDWKNLIQIVK